LSALVHASNTPGVIETVPTYRSLMVVYDPLTTDATRIISAMEGLLEESHTKTKEARLLRIPACYEAGHAPDLAEIAERIGRSAESIIRVHSETCFHVYMIGFVPGYPYLGDLPDWLEVPRRTDPRLRVPAGSIGISGKMTGIYPIESPGGWHLIGATPVRLFDVRSARPSLLNPGDKVRFDPISAAEFEAIRADVQAEVYQVTCERIGV
jgi:KipI family sensor histidine kinase inhibitor